MIDDFIISFFRSLYQFRALAKWQSWKECAASVTPSEAASEYVTLMARLHPDGGTLLEEPMKAGASGRPDKPSSGGGAPVSRALGDKISPRMDAKLTPRVSLGV